MKLRNDGRPDARTAEGRAFYARSEAALKGWETRRENIERRIDFFEYEAPVFFDDDIYEIDY